MLLSAHGSRRAEANAELVQLAELVRGRMPGRVVEIAYLELAEPTIPQGAAACVRPGISRVLMVPYFLSYGSHVVEDLERYRAEFEAAFPGVRFTVAPPLGLHPLIVDVVLARIAEADGASGSSPSIF